MGRFDSQIADLAGRGKNQYEIGAELGINQSTVSRTLGRLGMRRPPGFCFKGHSLEGRKQCRICQRESIREWKRRKRRALGVPLKGEKPFCKRGHPRTPDNVRNGRYDCAVCHRNQQRNRHAQKIAAFVEFIDPDEVWRRCEGVCGICGQPADPADWHIDHIVPLAKGGEHSYANVQVAHPRCNCKKGARI